MTYIYTKTETDNLLNAKQANLTFTSPLTNTANTVSINLTPYSTTSINDTKYLKLDGTNTMALNSSIILTGTGKFSGDGSLLTNLPYANITGTPDLTLYNGWTKSGDTIYNTSLTNGKVGIGLTNPTGRLEIISTFGSGLIRIKYGHETRYSINSIISDFIFKNFTSQITTNEIAHFGYVDSYDAPTLRTPVLKITRDELMMSGDMYLNKTTLSSSRGVYLTAKSNSISNLFSSKPPFAAYFAEDFSGNTIPNYIKNGRDATTTGTITKVTDEVQNTVTVPITYITGTTSSTITFATGTIPTTFTILSLTRYNGGSRYRVLTSKTTGNWLHGHWAGKRGAVHYNNGFNANGYTNNLDN